MNIFALLIVFVSSVLLFVPMIIVNSVAAAADSGALYANWFFVISFFTGLIPRLLLQALLIYGLVLLFRGIKLSRRASTGVVLLSLAGVIIPYVGIIAGGDMPQWLLFTSNALVFGFAIPFLALGILAVRARA